MIKKRFIGLVLIFTSITYAGDINNSRIIKIKTNENMCYTSNCMSTQQLQHEVEKLSLEGKLPFEMGLELIKRWTDNQVS